MPEINSQDLKRIADLLDVGADSISEAHDEYCGPFDNCGCSAIGRRMAQFADQLRNAIPDAEFDEMLRQEGRQSSRDDRRPEQPEQPAPITQISNIREVTLDLGGLLGWRQDNIPVPRGHGAIRWRTDAPDAPAWKRWLARRLGLLKFTLFVDYIYAERPR